MTIAPSFGRGDVIRAVALGFSFAFWVLRWIVFVAKATSREDLFFVSANLALGTEEKTLYQSQYF
jgi:hypothetical protein